VIRFVRDKIDIIAVENTNQMMLSEKMPSYHILMYSSKWLGHISEEQLRSVKLDLQRAEIMMAVRLFSYG
jgi:hypothetical protein